jgi:hypothetical protein
MIYLYSSLMINEKSDDRYFVYRVESKDCCHLRAVQWCCINDWNKSYADPRRTNRSRFRGALVRRNIGFGQFALMPYEIERRWIADRIASLLSSRMHSACRKYDPSLLPVTPTKMAKEFLGCSISALVEKFEDKMADGMDWDNFGARGWVIDHILPVSSFDFRRLSHIRKACHHSNLRPCWESENIRKGAKVPYAIK